MGLATAKALGKFGPVLVGGRNEKRLANAVAKLEADGVEAYGKTVDIADRASLDEFAAYAASIAPLGNVVNAAGVDTGGGDLIVKVNMVGTINFVEAFLPYLEEGSALVNYSSITGYFVQPTPEEREIWDDPNNPAFFDKVKAAIDAREVPEAMRAMARTTSTIRYPRPSRNITRVRTHGGSGRRAAVSSPSRQEPLTHPCCARPPRRRLPVSNVALRLAVWEILMRWPSSSCACSNPVWST